MRRLTLSVLSLAFLAACQPATTELTEEQKATIADEVNAISAEFWDAWRETDLDRAMSYFYNSPDLAVAAEGAVNYGYAETDAQFRPAMANVASQDITITSSQTMVLAPDVVCVMETATFTSTDTDGVTGPEMRAAFTAIWVCRGGEWKINIAHESFPPTESS